MSAAIKREDLEPMFAARGFQILQMTKRALPSERGERFYLLQLGVRCPCGKVEWLSCSISSAPEHQAPELVLEIVARQFDRLLVEHVDEDVRIGAL